MNGRTQVIGTVLVAVSTWLIARYVKSAAEQHHRRAAKKTAKEAVQTWEGEGGAIIDAAPRPSAG